MNAVALLLALTLAPGGWGPRGCGPVGPSAAFVPQGAYAPMAQGPVRVFMRPGNNAAYPCSADCSCGCQQGGDCPCAKRKAATKTAEADDVFGPASTAVAQVDLLKHPGVVTERLNPASEQIFMNGGDKPLSKVEYCQQLTAGLSDDSNQLFVCYRGPEETCNRLLRDFDTAPELVPFKGNVRLQVYPPGKDALAAADRDGKPLYPNGVCIVAPDGKEAHRKDEYTNAAELAGALRKARQDYDAKKTPDLNRPLPSWPGLGDVPPEQLVVLGIVVVAFLGILVYTKKG